MATNRRSSKPKDTKAAAPKADVPAETVKLPPTQAPRGEGPGNLRARAENFLKRRGDSKA